MKAAQFREYGGPDVLELVETAEPHAGPGEIRIAVRAAGINAMDWKIRAGYLREMMPLPLPAGSGMDAAGIVDEIGDGADGVALGDAVFGTGTSTYAEYAVLADWARKPDSLSFAEAAGYPVAVQFARARGAKVIATASEANQGYLKELGATPTTYGEGLAGRVRELAPGGVDAALDIAGSGVIPELIELTGNASRVISIADFTAGDHEASQAGHVAGRTVIVID